MCLQVLCSRYDERLPSDNQEILRSRKRALQQAATWFWGHPGTQDELVRMQRMMHSMDDSSQEEAIKSLRQYPGKPIPEQF